MTNNPLQRRLGLSLLLFAILAFLFAFLGMQAPSNARESYFELFITPQQETIIMCSLFIALLGLICLFAPKR